MNTDFSRFEKLVERMSTRAERMTTAKIGSPAAAPHQMRTKLKLFRVSAVFNLWLKKLALERHISMVV